MNSTTYLKFQQLLDALRRRASLDEDYGLEDVIDELKHALASDETILK